MMFYMFVALVVDSFVLHIGEFVWARIDCVPCAKSHALLVCLVDLVVFKVVVMVGGC